MLYFYCINILLIFDLFAPQHVGLKFKNRFREASPYNRDASGLLTACTRSSLQRYTAAALSSLMECMGDDGREAEKRSIAGKALLRGFHDFPGGITLTFFSANLYRDYYLH